MLLAAPGRMRSRLSVVIVTLAATCAALAAARPSGAVELVLDAQGAGPGQELLTAYAVAYDPVGDRYIVPSHENSLVFAVEASGAPGVSAILDASGDGSHSLAGPWGVAVRTSDGAVFVSGANSDNVFRITQGGVVTQVLDATGAGPGQGLLSPRGLSVATDGSLFVTGYASNNVLRVPPGGAAVSEIIDAGGDGLGNGLVGPIDVDADSQGRAWVSGHVSNNVLRWNGGGSVEELVDASGDGQGNPLSGPWGISVDASGALVVAGHYSDNVLRRTSAGVVELWVDSTGNGIAPLTGPAGLATGPTGEVYVSGVWSDDVLLVDRLFGGTTTLFASQTGDGQGNTLEGPYAIGLDDDGRLLVASAFSANVLRFGATSLSELVPALAPAPHALLALGVALGGVLALRRSRGSSPQ